MADIISAEDLRGLLELLHSHGYRLRRLSPDILELADEVALARPVPVPDFSEGRGDKAELEEYERDKWAHVGGKPEWLREPGRRPANPSADKDGAA